MYIILPLCTHAHMHTHTYARTHAHTYARTHAHTCTHTHTNAGSVVIIQSVSTGTGAIVAAFRVDAVVGAGVQSQPALVNVCQERRDHGERVKGN